MARTTKKTPVVEPIKDIPSDGRPVDLAAMLSTKRTLRSFDTWVVGLTPLICHAWSEKAKREMLDKQIGATRVAKEKRDPDREFVDSLYDMGDGRHGFPVSAIKNALISSAHQKKGIPKTDVLAGLWLDSEMVRVRPALAGAICDMPLIPIHSGKPEMREDMVRVGVGLQKKSSLAYRAQFWPWAFRLRGKFVETMIAVHQLSFLLDEAGFAVGVGDWRNEKRGVFGAFRMADIKERMAWEAYAAGKGPLPDPTPYAEAAE